MELVEKELKPRDWRAVRAALANLQSQNPDRLLVPADIVAEAENEASPLHRFFLWDDSAAAVQWRLMQARLLIRKITVTLPDDQTETEVPKYLSLRADRKRPGGGYRETSRVLNSKQLLAELEETFKADLEGFLSRYNLLKDLVERVRRAAGIKERKAAKARK